MSETDAQVLERYKLARDRLIQAIEAGEQVRFADVLVGDGELAFEVGIQNCVVEPALPGFKRERQHLHVYQRGKDDAWYIAAAMSGNQ